ncbi:MAG: chorismate-binding protein, partial [Haloferacaceae archaeon]
MRIAVETDRAAFRAAAADVPPGTRVPVEVRVTVPDPYEAYRRAREGPGGIYLETTGGQSGWGYFGVDPIERLTVGADAVVADRGAGGSEDAYADYRRPSPTLSALAGLLDGGRLARGECEVPYPCGVVGWLSYDVARELETLPEQTVDERGLPRLQAAVFDRLAAWEEPHGGDVTLHVTACPTVGGSDAGTDGDLEATRDDRDTAYDAAVERARDLAERALEGDPGVGPAPVDAAEARFESDCGPAAFADRVRQVKEYIRDGDTFQANISQRLVAPAAVHPVEAYDALREVNPAPYSGLLEFARDPGGGDDVSGVDLVSASPELLLHREGRRLVTEPIAGTRPRGDSPAADADYERDLLVDEKERAEHAMLVDLERNDLGKVCEYGSVEVSEYRRVDRYSEVMHLVSLVEGTAAPDVGLA